MEPGWSNLLALFAGVARLTWANLLIIAVGGLLIYLAIAREYEPVLLIPIGAGAILANIPGAGMGVDVRAIMAGEQTEGVLYTLYKAGIETELFPLLLFIGIGAMTDFGPLLSNPRMVLLGAAGQFGIFGVLLLALATGRFTLHEAASIGIIGAIDGPTSIFVASKLAPHLLAPIAVCAYTYMSLVPIIQPPIMRLLTTARERSVRMPYAERPAGRRVRILFPIIVTLLTGFLAPQASPLIGVLMFGNLMRESGVVDRLVKAAGNEIANVTTVFLGLTIGATMVGEAFANVETLIILVLGVLAFALDTAAGVLFGKLLYVATRGKFNPLIGAAGISAFPMAARVVNRAGLEADYDNFLLMHAMGANTAGQVASVLAGGIVLALLMR
ncbi:MAG: sodium ion-translocating decarboxylase subunit beta [Chloroflexi bacterium]|nr:sodium ion-translocating decarboxylase subunit beta [Chloroflexota bacterium]